LKNLARIFVLVLAVLFIAGCGTQQEEAAETTKEEIKIGGLFALSGKAEHIGKPTLDVANMVVDQINKDGGVDGAMIKLVVADTRSEPSQAAVAMKKLIQKDKVVAICGPTTTGAIMACLPTIEQEQIPVVACVGGTAAVVPVEERKWVFKSPQMSKTAVERIYMYLQKNDIDTIAILTATDKFGQEGKQLLSSLAGDYGIKIVAEEQFDPTDLDMSVQIGKIAGKKPQAMVVWTIGPAGAVIAKNAKQLNVDFGVIQCHGQPDPIYIKLAEDAADGSIMPSTKLMVADQLPDDDPQKEVVTAFVEEYKNRDLGAMGTHSGYAWDAIQIIARALEEAGTDPEKLRDAIENTTDYIGVSGIYNMSPQDHCGLDTSSLVMIEVRDGKWVLID